MYIFTDWMNDTWHKDLNPDELANLRCCKTDCFGCCKTSKKFWCFMKLMHTAKTFCTLQKNIAVYYDQAQCKLSRNEKFSSWAYAIHDWDLFDLSENLSSPTTSFQITNWTVLKFLNVSQYKLLVEISRLLRYYELKGLVLRFVPRYSFRDCCTTTECGQLYLLCNKRFLKSERFGLVLRWICFNFDLTIKPISRCSVSQLISQSITGNQVKSQSITNSVPSIAVRASIN